MLNVLDWLRKRSLTGRIATKLYGSTVAQARKPGFYTDFGVPDTPNGRYEMIVLHMFLVLQKLRETNAKGDKLSRALVEQFVTDMDDSLRQLAVGDTVVPKKVKKAAAGLLERVRNYGQATSCAQPMEQLSRALGSYVFDVSSPEAPPPGADLLARYVMECRERLTIGPGGTAQGFVAPANFAEPGELGDASNLAEITPRAAATAARGEQTP